MLFKGQIAHQELRKNRRCELALAGGAARAEPPQEGRLRPLANSPACAAAS